MFGFEDKLKKSIVKLKKGDIDEFEKIYDMTFAKMMHFAKVYLTDKQSAEDVVNDAYIKLCQNLDRIDPSKNTMNWLIKVVKNTAMKYNARKRDISVDDVGYNEEMTYVDLDAEDKIMLKDTYISLSSDLKELFYLYYIEEKTLREIAKMKNKSKSMIWKDVQKLNAILKTGLGIN